MNNEQKPSEADLYRKEQDRVQQYKQEALKIKKDLLAAQKKSEPYAEHMRARHIEGLHAFYKQKLGYTGAADIASMKEFKHNYFESKANQEEAANFFSDFYAHKAILTFYDELFKKKSEKPLHKLDEKAYQERVASAMSKAKELRKENKLRYNLLLQDYAGITHEMFQGLIKKHKNKFIDAYVELLPRITAGYAQEHANVDFRGILQRIKPQHTYYDKELGDIVNKLTGKEEEQPYMAAPYDEEIDPENYTLPERTLPEQAPTQQQAPEAKPTGQVAPTPGAPAPAPSGQ